MKSYKLLLAFIICLQFKVSCQNTHEKPGFSVGNILGTRVNIDTFKLQKEIKVTKGFKFGSAVVYFSGANFQYVNMAIIYGPSLSSLDTLINKCSAGSTITFDNVKLLDKNNLEILVDGKGYVFYGGNQSVGNYQQSESIKELLELMKKDFISGTLYFSGENFSNVVTVNLKGHMSAKPYFNRCAPGSKVTFENCIYKNADGTLSKPVNKSLTLD